MELEFSMLHKAFQFEEGAFASSRHLMNGGESC